MMSRKSIFRHELERLNRRNNKVAYARESWGFEDFKTWECWVYLISFAMTFTFLFVKLCMGLLLVFPLGLVALLFFGAPLLFSLGCICTLPGYFIVSAIHLLVYGDIEGKQNGDVEYNLVNTQKSNVKVVANNNFNDAIYSYDYWY